MNANYEEQVTRLCSSPFISEAYRQSEDMGKLHEFQQSQQDADEKISHLQEAAATHHAALMTLKKQANQLRSEKVLTMITFR